MLNWENIEYCSKCYEREDKWIRSKRYFANKKYEHYISPSIQATDIATGKTDQKISYIDIRFSNICNLACKMCCSFSSSSRQSIEKKLERDPNDIHWVYNWLWNIDDFKVMAPDLKEIYIVWGEPFTHKEFKELIFYLCDNDYAKDIFLRVNTNLTIIDQEVFNKFHMFKKLEFFISCDGYKEDYNKIRLWGDWKIFKNNFLEVLKFKSSMSNISISINIVVQIDNISQITDLYYFFEKLWVDYINLLLLNQPAHFDIRILPDNFREKKLEKIKNFIEDNPTRKKNFIDIIKALELGKSNPELLTKYSYESRLSRQYILK